MSGDYYMQFFLRPIDIILNILYVLLDGARGPGWNVAIQDPSRSAGYKKFVILYFIALLHKIPCKALCILPCMTHIHIYILLFLKNLA